MVFSTHSNPGKRMSLQVGHVNKIFCLANTFWQVGKMPTSFFQRKLT